MTDTVLVALIAAVPATIASVAAIGALVVSLKGNRLVNGRLSELLAAVGAEQHASGRAEGIEEERHRENGK